MKSHRAGDGQRILAVFIDFENLALGFFGRRDRFQIEKVLERLVEKGKIVAKKAYADWSRFGGYAGSLHECAIELIEIPKRSMTGKNSADIRLVVDAVDLAYSKDHIDTFVIVSGDSDFSPLVSKLKELGKHVIGLGLQDATSNLLRDNCDEFIYYEDLDRPTMIPLAEDGQLPENKRKAFGLMLESLLALRRENKDLIFSSMVKDTMKRKRPSFNEEYHGYRTFSDLLEDAAKHGLVEIEKSKASGTYVVTKFGDELRHGVPPVAALPPAKPLAIPPRPTNGGGERERTPPPRQEREPPREREPRPAPPSRPKIPGPYYPPQPATPPPAPAIVPPVVSKRPVEDDEVPALGLNLMAEVDDFDDEVPSYAPGKKVEKKTPAVKPKPAAAPESVAKPKATRAAKPAEPKPTEKKPAASRPAAVTKPEPVSPPPPPAVVAKPKPVSPPPAKPKPTADDDSGFGAGLDD
jgi:uncharacterized protein (TIGR00288 family)